MQSAFVHEAGALLGAATLGVARTLSCLLFLPGFSRAHLGGAQRSGVALAVSLPQIVLLHQQLSGSAFTLGLGVAMLGLKEACLGALLGMLLAAPFWAFRAAFTLMDNQRGANAAQLVNPSMQADSSILGDLAERAALVAVIQAGVFVSLFDALGRSYVLWPALAGWPQLDAAGGGAALSALLPELLWFMSAAASYSAPVIALLLLIELTFAIASVSAQGLPIYESAMPVKGLAALVCLLLYFDALIAQALPGIAELWQVRIPEALGSVLRTAR
jgi:type III secretion protein T